MNQEQLRLRSELNKKIYTEEFEDAISHFAKELEKIQYDLAVSDHKFWTKTRYINLAMFVLTIALWMFYSFWIIVGISKLTTGAILFLASASAVIISVLVSVSICSIARTAWKSDTKKIEMAWERVCERLI